MTKKKVMQVSSYYFSGMSYQENIYCRELAKKEELLNFFVSSAVNYPRDGTYRYLSEIYGARRLIPGVYVEDNVINFRIKPLFEKNGKVLLPKYLTILSNINPDVVLIHGATSLFSIQTALYKLIFKKKFKLLIDDHSLNSLQEESILSRLYRYFFKYLFSSIVNAAADIYLPLSKETENIMVEQYGLDKEKMDILYLGADDSIFKPLAIKRNAFRDRYGIDVNEFVFLYTGKIIKSKRLDEILRAFKNTSQYKFRIVFIGPADHDFKQSMLELAKSYKLNNHVMFIENVSSALLTEAFNGADLGLWPFGPTISTVEAQLCGLPCVVQASGYNKERIICDGTASGYLVSNTGELETVVSKVLNNQVDMETLKQNSLVNSTRYKNSVIVNKLVEHMFS